MNDNQFSTCADCMNKQSLPHLPKGQYYCPLVVDEIPGGIVREDYDAIGCERKGRLNKYYINKK